MKKLIFALLFGGVVLLTSSCTTGRVGCKQNRGFVGYR